MKILQCPICRDVVGLLGQEWRKCICGASGGQYNRDLITATLGGRARVFGVANPFFNEMFPFLNEEGKAAMHKKLNYVPIDCWWGEYAGDAQIFRIESPDGPRLNVRIVRIDAATNHVAVIDKRPYTIDGRVINAVSVPRKTLPTKCQTLKKKKQ